MGSDSKNPDTFFLSFSGRTISGRTETGQTFSGKSRQDQKENIRSWLKIYGLFATNIRSFGGKYTVREKIRYSNFEKHGPRTLSIRTLIRRPLISVHSCLGGKIQNIKCRYKPRYLSQNLGINRYGFSDTDFLVRIFGTDFRYGFFDTDFLVRIFGYGFFW